MNAFPGRERLRKKCRPGIDNPEPVIAFRRLSPAHGIDASLAGD